MKADVIFSALNLPAGSHVNRRIPKKLLLEHASYTANDRRVINDGMEGLFWLAELKPTNIGVSTYRDETRDYLEIAVLNLNLRSQAKARRVIELVHRAVPYPVFLLTQQYDQFILSAVHIRWSQSAGEKTVLDGAIVTIEINPFVNTEHLQDFLNTLDVSQQPRSTLFALYQGLIDTVCALKAANITGIFTRCATSEQAAKRRESLLEYERLTKEIGNLRTIAVNETQMSGRVEINLHLKRLELAKLATRAQL